MAELHVRSNIPDVSGTTMVSMQISNVMRQKSLSMNV